MGLHDSNHPLADRRFAWAKALTVEGDHAAAADLLGQVIELVPNWAPAWAALAETCERLDRREEALAAWQQAAARDPGGRLGAGWRSARLAGAAPAEMPDAYVRALFDDYAPRFERHLVGTLQYCGPQLLSTALAAAAPDRTFVQALDLGCGTGLMARALRARVEAFDGVDLSSKMIEAAGRTGLYRELRSGSLIDALTEADAGRYDLVTAADVLVYVGDLEPVMSGVRRVLAPGGLFAFTAQEAVDRSCFTLGTDLRFAHARSYVEAGIIAAGLELVSMVDGSVRIESGIAVPGLVGVARQT